MPIWCDSVMHIAGHYANCLVGMMALCKLLEIMQIAGHYANCWTFWKLSVGMMALWKLPNEGDILQKCLSSLQIATKTSIMQNAQFLILPITYIYIYTALCFNSIDIMNIFN